MTLEKYAEPAPIEIRVNMFRLRWRIEDHHKPTYFSEFDFHCKTAPHTAGPSTTPRMTLWLGLCVWVYLVGSVFLGTAGQGGMADAGFEVVE
jgi:hypothetical protein